jgi:hypothetical protein
MRMNTVPNNGRRQQQQHSGRRGREDYRERQPPADVMKHNAFLPSRFATELVRVCKAGRLCAYVYSPRLVGCMYVRTN